MASEHRFPAATKESKRRGPTIITFGVLAITVFWFLSLTRTSAQGDPLLHALQPPIVYSGPDIAVRVHHRIGEEKLVGELLVRIDGKWTPVDLRTRPSK